jgi:subtilisin-like proprotein convertase family protein
MKTNLKGLLAAASSNFKSFRTHFVVLFFSFFLWSSVGWGQVTVTNPSNTTPAMSSTYTSLALAIADVNNRTAISGPVTITLDANTPQTAPAGGYSITNVAITGGSTTNRFIFDGGGNTITAPSQTSGNLNDAIFKIIGADFITIQNFTMQENAANTTTTAASNNMTEFGVALFYATTTNGAQNNIIQNNTISLNRTYQNTFGIYSNSTHSATAATTSASATTTAGGNSGLKVYGNSISNVNNGILVLGPTAAADFNTGIDIGGTSSSTANTISNFGSTGTFSAYANVSGTVYGIFIRNSIGFNISYNSITSSNGGVTAGTLRGIFNMSASIAPTGTYTNNINNNTIALTYGVASGTLQGITVEATNATTTSIGNINNNNFTALTASVTTSAAITAISSVAPHFSLSISGNTFTNLTTNTTGSFTFFGHSYTMPASGSQTINNNSIVTAFNKTGAGGIVTISTSSTSSPNGSSHIFTNNNFSNITVTGATTLTGVFNSDGAGSSPTRTVTGNTFNNWTGGTNAITGFSYSYIGGTTSSYSNNSLTNITGQGAITGINLGSSANLATTVNVANNTINNLSSTGTGGTVTGITCTNTSTTININSNSINTLSSTGASSSVIGISIGGAATTNVFQNTISALSGSGATSPLVHGIQVSGGTTVNIYINKIHTLSQSGAINTTNGAVNGILLSGGTTVNTYNNLIGELTAPSASLTDAIRGISITSTTTSSTHKVYNNTIYLSGSGGTNFGGTGLFHTISTTATTSALDLQNNMIFCDLTPNGTGLAVAYRRSAGAASNLANYASTSNKNLFYAGTPGASNLIYSDITSSAQTMASYQAGVFTAGTIASRDANSFTETSFNPATYFVSTTGSNANFLQPASGLTTQAEGGGNTIAMCSPDYNGVTRPGFSGAAFDVGAWEFAGVSPAPVLTNMVPSPALTSQCTKAARTISIDITTTSGTISGATLNYSHNGTAQTAVTMTNSSGNTWTGTMLAPSTGNATVTWSITATNSLGLTTSYTGTSYSDEPNTGITASASATPSTICSGNTTSLNFSAISSQTVSGARNAPASTSNTTASSYGLVFDVTTAFTLNSVQVYNGSSAGTMTIVLQNNSGTQLQTLTTPTIPSGTGSTPTTVSIGWNIPVGSGYRLLATTSPSLVRESSLGGFPYAVGSFGSITSGYISGTTTTYYYFYNWSVTPLVSTPSSYSWSDGSSVIGTSNPQTATPSGTPTYTCTATVNGCSMTAAVTPTVNPLPTAPTATNSSQCGAGVPSASVTDNNSFTTPTFKWYDASTGGSLLQSSTSSTYVSSISTTTTFYVTVTNPSTGCESARTAVIVTVTQPDAISATTSAASICLGQSVTLTAANTASTPTQSYSYSWLCATAGSGATSANTSNPASITPSAAGSYTYTVTGTDGACSAINTVAVTVNALPNITSATASPSTVCSGSSITLTGASIPASAGTASIGSGNLTNSSYVNPFYSLWSNIHTQHLILASELTASGLVAGNLTSIGLDITSAGSLPMINFSLKIGSTNNTTAASFVTSGLIQVYTNASLMPTSGINNLSFSSPFYWDGVSNIILEFCHGNASSSATMSRTCKSNATSYVSSIKAHVSSATASSSICGNTTSNVVSYSERPMFQINGQVGTNQTSSFNWSWNSTPALSTASGTTTETNTGASATTKTYTVTATNATTGCSSTATTSAVTINPATVAPTATNSTHCGSQTPTCSVTGTGTSGNTFAWYTVSTGGTAISSQTASTLSNYPIATTTTLYVSENNGTCQSDRTPVTITVSTPPSITAAASVSPVCSGSPTVLTASSTNSGYTYSWDNSLGAGASVTANPTTNTTYTVTATDNSGGANNGCATTATVAVTTNPLPSTLSLTPSTTQNICAGNIQSIVASGASGATTTSSTSTNNTGTISLAIPDNNSTGISSTLAIANIPSSATISQIDVSFDLTHTWLNDAEITLTAPNGKVIALAADQGPGSSGSYNSCTITSNPSAIALSTTSTPISGTFRANATAASGLKGSFGTNLTQVFSDLFSVPNGNWILTAFDDYAGDEGTLTSYSISITYTVPNITWSPTTELYTDAAATTAYSGTPTTVYSKPTANRTYTATATTSNGCTASASVTLNYSGTPLATAPANNAYVFGATTNTNYNTAANWYTYSSTNGYAIASAAPTSSDVVVIPATSTCVKALPSLSATSSIADVEIQSGSVLSLNGNSLSIAGALSGTGTIKGSSTSSLSFTGSASNTLRMDQTILGTTNVLRNLTLSGTGTTTLANALNITAGASSGSVTAGSGTTLTTGGFLTLKSDASGTARIAQSAGTISGNVTQERFVPGKAVRKWSFLASPVTQSLASAWQQQIHITGPGTGGTMCNNYTISGTMTPHSNGFDVTQLQNPSFYTYDAATDNFVANTTGTNNFTLTPGNGYMVLVRGDRNDATNGGCVLLSANNQAAFTSIPVTLAATGAVGQGTITKVLPAGYSLIGNPYPCELDFNQFNTTNASVISGGYWTYYPTNATYTFSTFNNGTSTNGGTQVIANGQSFLVNSTSGGTITFNEAHKSTTANNGGFRLHTTWDELIRVGLSNNQGNRFDEVVVRFGNDAAITTSINEYDAASVNGGDHWIKTLKNNTELAIQTRPNTYQNDTVALAIHAKNAGTYQLGFSEYQGLSNTEVYLIDQQENLIQNVKALPSYDFSVAANTTTANRFKLIFNAKTSGVGSIASNTQLQVYPNPTKDKVSITCNSLEYGAYQVKVRTITGAEVLQAKGFYKNGDVIELSLNDLAVGMYLLELSQDNGFRATQKITKH